MIMIATVLLIPGILTVLVLLQQSLLALIIVLVPRVIIMVWLSVLLLLVGRARIARRPALLLMIALIPAVRKAALGRIPALGIGALIRRVRRCALTPMIMIVIVPLI